MCVYVYSSRASDSRSSSQICACWWQYYTQTNNYFINHQNWKYCNCSCLFYAKNGDSVFIRPVSSIKTKMVNPLITNDTYASHLCCSTTESRIIALKVTRAVLHARKQRFYKIFAYNMGHVCGYLAPEEPCN